MAPSSATVTSSKPHPLPSHLVKSDGKFGAVLGHGLEKSVGDVGGREGVALRQVT